MSLLFSKAIRSTQKQALSVVARRGYVAYPDAKVTVLPNGVQVATEATNSGAAAVGIYIDSGSRNETDTNNGAAHFLEHMTFKGTSKLSQSEFEDQVESLGAILDTSTSRELCSFSALVQGEDAGKALGLVADAVTNVNFSDAILDKERKTVLRVLDEINEDPEQVTLDYLHSTAYQGTSLAKTIYGTTSNIENMKVQDLKDYIDQNYSGDRIVVTGCGSINHDELVEIAKSKLGHLPQSSKNTSVNPVRYTGSEVTVRDDNMPYGYAAVAFEAVSPAHPDYFPLQVANQMMGSWNNTLTGSKHCSSPLVQLMTEEKHALSYKNFTHTYSDTGLFGAYYVADRVSMDDAIFEIQSEWLRMAINAGPNEVERAKKCLKNALLKDLDCLTTNSENLAKDIFQYGRRMSPTQLADAIDAVSLDQVKSALSNTLYDRCPAVAAYGAIEALPDYNRIRGANHWFRL